MLSGYLIFEQSAKKGRVFISNEYNHASGGIPVPYMRYPDSLQKQISSQFDKRYRTFFNDILVNNSNCLPPNVNVISWNYDLQLEGSYCRDYKTSLELAQKRLNVFPSKSYDSSIQNGHTIKLNGTAGINFSENSSSGFENFISGFDDDVESVCGFLVDAFNRNYEVNYSRPTLTFAFESNQEAIRSKDQAKRILEETNYLVIIGYSFPTMNNPIDKELFSNCNIDRIYLQIPSEYQKKILQNIRKIDSELAEACELIDDCDEFFIPS
jgi:hypothetical protein